MLLVNLGHGLWPRLLGLLIISQWSWWAVQADESTADPSTSSSSATSLELGLFVANIVTSFMALAIVLLLVYRLRTVEGRRMNDTEQVAFQFVDQVSCAGRI